MSAPFKRRPAAARRVGVNGFLRLALCCARNVYGGIDRRMPEARALAVWLGQSASAFGLADSAIPDDEALHRGKHRGVADQDWRRIVAALDEAETQVLPNGNLVVEASQEFRVNSELRVLSVSGVVRPQDIASDNTVPHDRMAEARISYGGRGTLTELQTPRWGQQMMDIFLPF